MSFTKSDLKEGMPVKLRGGSFCVVFCGYIRGRKLAFPIKNLNDDLTNKYENLCDIVAAWPVPVGCVCIERMLNTEGEPIWVRKDPIKISDDERVILSNIEDNYIWIARDRDGSLYVYDNKPEKRNSYWSGNIYKRANIFEHLFQWVRWGDDEPVNFRELLKGE